MKLISMTDFVFEIGNKDETTHIENLAHIYNYAIFLKQPLKLEMFVPCDEDGNILEDVTGEGIIPYYVEKVHRFLTAKEKVLFDGFELQKQDGEILVTFDKNPVWVNWNNLKTIEDLIYLKPILTPNAIKQLGL